MLQPNPTNKLFHARTRAKAKMYEYDVPEDRHINLEGILLTDLLDLTVGMLGALTAGAEIRNLEEEKYRLLFSAQYFSALIESRELDHNSALIKLLSAAAYFLAEYPGSASVVLEDLAQENFSNIEQLLFFILKRERYVPQGDEVLYEEINNLGNAWNQFLEGTISLEDLSQHATALRTVVYSSGGDEDLLLVDVIRTVVLKRFAISARIMLTEHSGIDAGLWTNYLSRAGALKEFWPSQVRLAEKGIFRGVSAVVQMPTSAGKTRASELIIRSSFLVDRGRLAVIVAPFRALCQEIYNDFNRHFSEDRDIRVGLVSDVLQNDFELEQNDQKSILILTPEKLDFLLRHNRELALQIGLIIYDEGHLFDDLSRGIKYELLLSSLKQKLPATAQVVLISAVISNATEIKDWLIADNGVLIDGKDLNPTNRSIGFVDWTRRNRFLQFVDEGDINQGLFFVPTVLQTYELEKRGRERARRFFPKSDNDGNYSSTQIAGFLGCRLSPGGLSAVFIGRKDSAQKLVTELVDAYERNIPIPRPSEFSENIAEAEKVITYIRNILGEESVHAKAAELGILVHHASIPHGLRLVSEHALQNSHFKTVVCTSTLAQGVNLPIRYLIISTDRQGRDKIKTRDFHNLMGRAGRSGKYTEGTVLFADPEIYRSRPYGAGGRWSGVGDLLNPSNSEPSRSRLLRLLENPEVMEEEVKVEWESEVVQIKKEIYSYLINALSEVQEVREMERLVAELTRNTLGYSQITIDEQKTTLTNIFLEIGSEILTQVPDLPTRLVFSRSILNIEQSKEVVELLRNNVEAIVNPESNLLDVFWPLLYRYSDNNVLKSFSEIDSLAICKNWIEGLNFLNLLQVGSEKDRADSPSLNMGRIIDLCEGGFSYNLSTLLSSFTELATLVIPEEQKVLITFKLSQLQKQLKYGLSSPSQVLIYELGFSDRRLTSEIDRAIGNPEALLSRGEMIALVRRNDAVRRMIEDQYPAYFVSRLNYLS